MAGKKTPLAILNETVTYECIYGRGCEGVCCQNGRPPVSPEEQARIDENLPKFLPHLGEKARKAVLKDGYLSKRIKAGKPMLRVIDSWCIFFEKGCVLHKVGIEDGDKFMYKPAPCSLFPLEQNDKDEWYVRQHNYKGEQWDLFCIAPNLSAIPATTSLNEEMAFARRQMEAEANKAAGLTVPDPSTAIIGPSADA